MVTEAVAELKGEEVREPAEVKLDLPVDAHLPPTTSAREELRLEAYRRLAAVTTEDEVDDIRAEWEDRYGPVPAAGRGPARVARLRAECLRLGVREVAVTQRAWPASARSRLKTSQTIRLQRLSRDAVYKEDLGQLQVPIKRGADPARALLAFLASWSRGAVTMQAPADGGLGPAA